MNRSKILVTGANGQLGSELRELSPAFPQYEFVFLSRADMPVHHPELVYHFLHTLKPQYLVNCAAYTAVDRAETEKDHAWLTNAEAPGVMAGICKQHHCRFLHISTDYVFNGQGSVPYKETDATGPVGVYGASKLKGEENALAQNDQSLIVRTSWVYSRYGHNFVKTMLRLMKEKEKISVVNDQQGSPTWAAGLAQALLELIGKMENGRQLSGVYHYCDGGITTWYHFAGAIKEMIHAACLVEPITTAAYPTPAKRPAWSALDTAKIEAEGIRIQPWPTQLQRCLQQLTVPE